MEKSNVGQVEQWETSRESMLKQIKFAFWKTENWVSMIWYIGKLVEKRF